MRKQKQVTTSRTVTPACPEGFKVGQMVTVRGVPCTFQGWETFDGEWQALVTLGQDEICISPVSTICPTQDTTEDAPRLRDIPQFTRYGNYEVDIPWAQLERYIWGQQKEYGLNLDPDFQRAHVWNREKQIAYVEFILRGGHSSRVLYSNHSHWNSGMDGEYVLVDGKQRLHAVRLFLRNQNPAFGHYLWEYADTHGMMGITFRWQINDLPTRVQVLQWYLDLNAGGVIHTSEEIEKVRALLEKETANG